MRFLIIFIFLLSNSVADETINIKNLVINKELKKYDSITFLDVNNDQLDLNNYQGNLILLNFLEEDRRWCVPVLRGPHHVQGAAPRHRQLQPRLPRQ